MLESSKEERVTHRTMSKSSNTALGNCVWDK